MWHSNKKSLSAVSTLSHCINSSTFTLNNATTAKIYISLSLSLSLSLGVSSSQTFEANYELSLPITTSPILRPVHSVMLSMDLIGCLPLRHTPIIEPSSTTTNVTSHITFTIISTLCSVYILKTIFLSTLEFQINNNYYNTTLSLKWQQSLTKNVVEYTTVIVVALEPLFNCWTSLKCTDTKMQQILAWHWIILFYFL